MNEKKRARGAPRRGPYAQKTASLATKLTEETMTRLTARAKASGMSISQMTEVAIVRGLDAEDDFHRYFGSALHRFEDRMIRAMPPRDATPDANTWSQSPKEVIRLLIEELGMAVEKVTALQGTTPTEATVAAEVPTRAGPSVPLRPKRILDVEDDNG